MFLLGAGVLGRLHCCSWWALLGFPMLRCASHRVLVRVSPPTSGAFFVLPPVVLYACVGLCLALRRLPAYRVDLVKGDSQERLRRTRLREETDPFVNGG